MPVGALWDETKQELHEFSLLLIKDIIRNISTFRWLKVT